MTGSRFRIPIKDLKFNWNLMPFTRLLLFREHIFALPRDSSIMIEGGCRFVSIMARTKGLSSIRSFGLGGQLLFSLAR
jgi:hypothetical protein